MADPTIKFGQSISYGGRQIQYNETRKLFIVEHDGEKYVVRPPEFEDDGSLFHEGEVMVQRPKGSDTWVQVREFPIEVMDYFDEVGDFLAEKVAGFKEVKGYGYDAFEGEVGARVDAKKSYFQVSPPVDASTPSIAPVARGVANDDVHAEVGSPGTELEFAL